MCVCCRVQCDGLSGAMTRSLCSMRPGDAVQISGPIDGPNVDLSPSSPIKKLGYAALPLCVHVVLPFFPCWC